MSVAAIAAVLCVLHLSPSVTNRVMPNATAATVLYPIAGVFCVLHLSPSVTNSVVPCATAVTMLHPIASGR